MEILSAIKSRHQRDCQLSIDEMKRNAKRTFDRKQLGKSLTAEGAANGLVLIWRKHNFDETHKKDRNSQQKAVPIEDSNRKRSRIQLYISTALKSFTKCLSWAWHEIDCWNHLNMMFGEVWGKPAIKPRQRNAFHRREWTQSRKQKIYREIAAPFVTQFASTFLISVEHLKCWAEKCLQSWGEAWNWMRKCFYLGIVLNNWKSKKRKQND